MKSIKEFFKDIENQRLLAVVFLVICFFGAFYILFSDMVTTNRIYTRDSTRQQFLFSNIDAPTLDTIK
jgi:dipeptide/tripeptide permease